MEPISKRTKKRSKKAAAEEQPASPVAQTVPTGGYLWARDEEELVDYEAEEPATFSPMEDDFSVVGDIISPLQTGNTLSPQQIMIFPLISRRLTIWRGRSARKFL